MISPETGEVVIVKNQAPNPDHMGFEPHFLHFMTLGLQVKWGEQEHILPTPQGRQEHEWLEICECIEFIEQSLTLVSIISMWNVIIKTSEKWF